jgi:glutamate/tyrosine decarboxylase-like PLP-dependent enzyme
MSIRQKMFREMKQKSIFRQAQTYAYAYIDNAFDRNVFPSEAAIHDLEQFNEAMPDKPGDSSQILELLHRYGSPATVAQIAGRYFGFVNGGAVPVSLAARWLSDVWDQNAALSTMSPAVAKLEEITESWLKDLFGLPETVVAGFVSGTSLAIVCGLAAARYRIYKNADWDINQKGLNGAPAVRIVAGRQAHATVIKAIALLGFGIENIEWVATDAQGRIVLDNLPRLDERTLLILQAGNVYSGAFDPFERICEKAVEAGTWVHIDGAFGLWAAGSERLKHLTKGMEKANSWSVDGHKTLNTPYDSGIVLCSDKEALVQALQASGSYIAYSQTRDGMLYTPEMSRRARVVEIWAALKFLGKKGVDDLVFGLHEKAGRFARELKAEGFSILNDVVFNQILVGCEHDDITQRTLTYIQQSGECWVGGATWDGKAVIRISVCSWATTDDDISRSVHAFCTAHRKAVQDNR